MSGKVPWGPGFFTPRKRGADIIGWQYTCRHPDHKSLRPCTKEIRHTVSGSSDASLHMLKYWSMLSTEAADKDSHYALWFSHVVPAREGDVLPALPLLEAMMQASVATDHAAPLEAPAAPPAVVDLLGEPDDILGGVVPGSGVPAEVHAAMINLAADGVIPITTQEQRRRNSLSKHSEYSTPAFLTPALRWGYIHPNLKAPQGFKWSSKGAGKLVLSIKGG
eukprot:1615255-Pyramimonas_sp.AAC.1